MLQVVPLQALPEPLTYLVDDELRPFARRGSRVIVPLARSQALGIVVREEVPQAPEGITLRAITDVLDTGPPTLPESLVDLALWAARYYSAPPGEVLRAALPARLVQQGTRKQRLRLTPSGQEALSAQQALLRRPDLDLKPKELALLKRLERSAAGLGRVGLVRDVGVTAVASCLARGWATVHEAAPAQRRKDLQLELVGDAEARAKALGRAEKQAALLAQVEAAGGSVRLGELPNRTPDARMLARRLAEKGILRVVEIELAHDPFAEVEVPPDVAHELTAHQARALEALGAKVGGGYAPFLLHGVTSSGKTEVYLQLIARALQLEGSGGAIVLVPEIALTPQLAARFRARFGDQVAVLHSGLSETARFDQWRQIRRGEVRIVVGARSAIFAPLEQPAVLIVDEEHDTSFKQEDGVRYNARDLALLRGQQAGAIVVLGSATPSLESYRAAEQGRLTLLELPERATPRPLPSIDIVDLRQYSTAPEGVLSAPLALALEATLEARQQAILFLNRRGFSPLVQCRACGHVFNCEHCSVSLTHHRRQQRLVCHYCGFGQPSPERCPKCAGPEIQLRGFGTERVEQVLAARFPSARVARLDRDTAAGRGLQQTLDRIRRREIDILVGTQMVTKGHDFPHVTLVGVLSADHGLHFPDFRAAERTFQLLTQVAGRAGRGERAGRVLIQTYSPDHPAILAARRHDYRTFCEQELAARRELSYPPFAHLVALHLDGENAQDVAKSASVLGTALTAPARARGVRVLGPAEAPLSRLKGRTRWMLLLKASTRPPLRAVVEVAQQMEIAAAGVRLTIDIDPVQML